MNDETLETLMVKVADGEATDEEREALMAYLADHPELREELDMHREINAITEGWAARLEQDLRDDERRKRGFVGLWTVLGIGLLLGGAGVLAGGGIVQLMIDPAAPAWVKVGSGALVAGTVVLLGVVGIRRMWNRDPYEEVVR